MDDEDYEIVSRHKWYCSEQWYATSRIKGRLMRMHRLILEAPIGLNVDHIDGDRLNNRRSNLRLATQAQNLRNMCTPITNTSGYKGVSWDKSRGLWCAKIQLNRKTINIGRFITKEDAARAYNTKATEIFGEYARLNIIKDREAI